MKKHFSLSLLFLASINILYCQKHHISFIYGGAFTGFADLYGKTMGLGYEYKSKSRLALFSSLTKTNTSGTIIWAYDSNRQRPIIGADHTRYGLFDLRDLDKNNQMQLKNQAYLSKYSQNHNLSLDIGAKLFALKSEKINLFVEARVALSRVEFSLFTVGNYVNIEGDDFWFNKIKKTEFLLLTPSHENIIDLGYGFGFGLEYKLNDTIKISFNPSYIEYLKDAQNRVTWTFQLGYAL